MAGFYGGYLGNEGAMNPGSAAPQAFGLPQPGSMVAGTPSFNINQSAGPLGQRPGEQLKRLYEGGTQQNQQLNNELRRRGIMPGSGPQLPLAQSAPGTMPMGNAGFFMGPQYAQMPAGFTNKTVS
jgi:hypothetical protein